MSDEPPSTLPPSSEPFPGSRTPGWNDPPTVRYNPQLGGGTGRTRLNLNKRIPFPLQGTPSADSCPKPTAIVPPSQVSGGIPPPPLSSAVNTAGSSAQPIAVVHPMPNFNAPAPCMPRMPAAATESVEAEERTHLPVDVRITTLRILREQIPLVQESPPSVMREDIERSLGVMEQLWQTGNLSRALQEKVHVLAKTILEKKYNEAMQACSALSANHSNECANWAMALRHLALTLQPRNEEMATNINSNIAIVPAMFVPAMPRQTAAASTADTSVTNRSAVQHI